MIREILTLVVDGISLPYYIQFDKDRQRFSFQPTLKNRSAPGFVLEVKDGLVMPLDPVPPDLVRQAEEKIREIISTNLFDNF